MYTVENIAKICHNANKALCEINGDYTQFDWENSPDWQKYSAIKGVNFCIVNPDHPPSANHEFWLAQKESEGWKYGPVKNVETKEHPCCVPYDQLPEKQKAKDYLFKSIVFGLFPFIQK